ncbi:unnamed protein product [Lepeophtheirus salmonis]|uniref:(salmon louse) hypothetical protein n=1 Tax=Lepeophtheirus salmonis TaxID=72036 RepID=A0A7R8D4W6_LEPSM|nr:unnamed protein product [Lepeophtheirus salmonis]CAF3024728.1 unnamed protein product [Lepeophtheirus salmonis]
MIFRDEKLCTMDIFKEKEPKITLIRHVIKNSTRDESGSFSTLFSKRFKTIPNLHFVHDDEKYFPRYYGLTYHLSICDPKSKNFTYERIHYEMRHSSVVLCGKRLVGHSRKL